MGGSARVDARRGGILDERGCGCGLREWHY